MIDGPTFTGTEVPNSVPRVVTCRIRWLRRYILAVMKRAVFTVLMPCSVYRRWPDVIDRLFHSFFLSTRVR